MLRLKSFLLALTSLCAFSTLAADTASISQQQLLSLMNAPKSEAFVVLDVRTEEEFNQGHIDGAINISHKDIENKLASLSQYKHTTVVVHCRSGHRAGIAEAILQKNGFSRLRHLDGDMNGWLEANLPTVTK